MPNGLPGFTQRLNALFDSSPDPATGRPYTNVAVADALRSYGVSITQSYLGQLRHGRKSEPSAGLVGGLAQFFDVSADYFFGSVTRVDQSELARRLRFLTSRPQQPVDVTELVAAVAASSGEPFDRSSWERLFSGTGPARVRQATLETIADYLEIPRDYLLAPPGDEKVDLIEARIDLVDAVAETGSTGISLRSIGEPTPETLHAIAAALRASRAETNDPDAPTHPERG
jgi:transcriptional regulator with XRE-family HTH domain